MIDAIFILIISSSSPSRLMIVIIPDSGCSSSCTWTISALLYSSQYIHDSLEEKNCNYNMIGIGLVFKLTHKLLFPTLSLKSQVLVKFICKAEEKFNEQTSKD